MANRQLVEYIKSQLRNKTSEDGLRTLLAQQGWADQDITAALREARSQQFKQVHNTHHNHFAIIAILTLVILVLGTALVIIAYRQTLPDSRPTTNPITITSTENNTVLTGWHVCATTNDGVTKDSCYQTLNEEDELYDCDKITDDIERSFCYRAKEAVILDHYNEVQSGH